MHGDEAIPNPPPSQAESHASSGKRGILGPCLSTRVVMRSYITSAFALVFATVPAYAQRQYRFELGASAGYYSFDNKTELDNAFGGSVRAGYWVVGPLSVEVEGSYAKPKTTS